MANEQSQRLGSQLRQACGRDPLIGTAGLTVIVADGILSITGTVPSAEARRRVGEIARQLAPDLELDNALVIAGPAPADDARLADRAGDWIQRHYPRQAAAMGAIVSAGRVYLRGTWPDLAAVRQAERGFGAWPGVAGVDAAGVALPKATVVPYAGIGPLDEIGIVNRLVALLAQHGHRLASRVSARMSGGTLELTGLVDDEPSRALAESLASGLPGVRQVDNHLVTRQAPTDADQAAEKRIRAAWGRPGDGATPVDVDLAVIGDTAYLFGQVDTPEAKDEARQMALQDPAIRWVQDWIVVVTRRSRPASGAA